MKRLRLRTAGSRGSLGLDIDGGYLAAVEVREGRISRAASADLPAGLFAEGEVNDASVLEEEIRAFFKRNDLSRRVRLGVANQQIAVRSMDLPVIEDSGELGAAVRFQAADTIAMPLEETVLDYQVVGESTGPEGSPRMRVVVAAARESMVARLADVVRGAGLRPLCIDLSAFALVRALAGTAHPGSDTAVTQDGDSAAASAPITGGNSIDVVPPGAQPSEAPTVALADSAPPAAQVLCHLGGVTNLAVAVGSTCLFTRSLSASRDSSGATVPVALAEEIRLSIDYYMAQPGAPAVGELVLAGPGSGDGSLAEELGSLLGMPVLSARPLPALDAVQIPPGDDPHRYTVAAGLALGATA